MVSMRLGGRGMCWQKAGDIAAFGGVQLPSQPHALPCVVVLALQIANGRMQALADMMAVTCT